MTATRGNPARAHTTATSAPPTYWWHHANTTVQDEDKDGNVIARVIVAALGLGSEIVSVIWPGRPARRVSIARSIH